MRIFLVLLLGLGMLCLSSPSVVNSAGAGGKKISLKEEMKGRPAGEYVAVISLDSQKKAAVRLSWDGKRGNIIKSLITERDVIQRVYDDLLAPHEGLEDMTIKTACFREGAYTSRIFMIWNWPSSRSRR